LTWENVLRRPEAVEKTAALGAGDQSGIHQQFVVVFDSDDRSNASPPLRR